MRLLTRRKIYRAFPELDGYDDAQCQRFMLAAGRSLLHKFLTWLSMTAIGAIGVLAAMLVGRWAGHASGLATPGNPDADLPVIGGVWLAVLLVAGPVMFWARDLLLWRRVGHVLRERGTCETCGYVLVGLAIGPGLLVTCPECGGETQVDESLGELVRDEQGRESFAPSHFSPGMTAWQIDPRVLRRRRRIMLWSALALAVSPLGLAAIYGVVLLAQSVAASRNKPTPATYAALFPSAPVPPNAPSAWAEVHLVIQNLRASVTSPQDVSSGSPGRVAASCPLLGGFRVSKISGTFANGAGEQATEEAIRDALDEISSVDGWATLSHALHLPDHRLLGGDLGDPSNSSRYTIPSELMRVHYLEIGRMNLARMRNNPAEFAAGAEDALQAAHMLAFQPYFAASVSGAHASLTWCSILDGARAGGPAWVEALYPVVRGAPRLPSTLEWVQAEHVGMMDRVCWLFENPSRVWLERWSWGAQLYFGDQMSWPTRVGFYWENARLVDRTFDPIEQSLASGMSMSAALNAAPKGSNLAIASYFPWTFQFMGQVDGDQVLQDGAIATIAIEKYKLDHGEYPPSLQALVDAGMLPGVPKDPYSGGPLVYERGGPKAAAHGVGYVLYSVGPDGNDDGLAAPDCLPTLPAGTKPGHDYSFPILDGGVGP